MAIESGCFDFHSPELTLRLVKGTYFSPEKVQGMLVEQNSLHLVDICIFVTKPGKKVHTFLVSALKHQVCIFDQS